MAESDASSESNEFPSNADAYETYEKIATRNRVWKARVHLPSGTTEVTIRIITFDPTVASREDIIQAVESLQEVQHPAVLKVLHWFFDENSLWLVHEANEWSTLYEVLEGSARGLEEPAIAIVVRQVLDVVVELHKGGHTWYDIRPVHLLLNRDGSIQVVLHSLRSIVRLKTRDSLPFVAPEQLQSKQDVDMEELWKHRFKGDVWALGVTALSLFLAHSPYEQLSLADITARIQTSSPLDEIEAPISDEFRSFLELCFQFDAADRPTADELLSHPFITNISGADSIQDQLADRPRSLDHGSSPHRIDAADERPVVYKDGWYAPASAPNVIAASPHLQLLSNKNTPNAGSNSSTKRGDGSLASSQPSTGNSSPIAQSKYAPPGASGSNMPPSLQSLNNSIQQNPMAQSQPTPLSQLPPNTTHSTGAATSIPVSVQATSAPANPGSSPLTPTSMNKAGANANGANSGVPTASQPMLVQQDEPNEITNVPMESYVGETKSEFVVFIRAIPGMHIRMTLESRSLTIAGTLPPLVLPADEGIVLHDPQSRQFERVVQFPTAVNANSFTKGYNKSASTLLLRIRKFVPVDLGTEIF